MARLSAARRRRAKIILGFLFGALACALGYFLWTNLDSTSLGTTGWSNRAVRHLRHWDGHRKLYLLVISSRNCDAELELDVENRCLASVSEVCPGFSTRSCILKQGIPQNEACSQTQEHARGRNDVKDMLLAAFRRVLPHLETLGWSKPRMMSEDDSSITAAVEDADIVICNAATFNQHKGSGKHFVILDETVTGRLEFVDMHIATSPQVLAILRTHLITAPHERWALYSQPTKKSGPYAKVHALVPMLWLWAFPLDCGASLNNLRFTGFFQPQLASWDRSQLADRPNDVLLLTTAAPKGSPLHAHRMLAVLGLQNLQLENSEVSVIITTASSYDEYVDRHLMDTKVVVSLLQPEGEVAMQDYEAWLAGCVLVKPRANDIEAYPNLFVPGKTVYDVATDFSNLNEVVSGILANLEPAQRMVRRVHDILSKYSQPERFAADIDEMLETSVRESMHLD